MLEDLTIIFFCQHVTWTKVIPSQSNMKTVKKMIRLLKNELLLVALIN